MKATYTKKFKNIIIVEEQDSNTFLEKFIDTYKNSIWECWTKTKIWRYRG